jgi:hypothetical protein
MTMALGLRTDELSAVVLIGKRLLIFVVEPLLPLLGSSSVHGRHDMVKFPIERVVTLSVPHDSGTVLRS